VPWPHSESRYLAEGYRSGDQWYRAKENQASAKIVKTEFNASLNLLGFPNLITFKECSKAPWSERKWHRKA